jgi:hypothetical protein
VRINGCQPKPQDRGKRSVAAGAGAHRWFRLGPDHEKLGPGRVLDVAGETGFAVAGEVAEWRPNPFLVFGSPFPFNLRISAISADIFNYFNLSS